MIILFITCTVFLIYLFSIAQSVKDVNTGKLTIVITGLENDDGEVLIALSDSRENYESDSEAYLGYKGKN